MRLFGMIGKSSQGILTLSNVNVVGNYLMFIMGKIRKWSWKIKKTAKGWKLFNVDEEGKLFCAPGDKIHYFEKGKWYSVEGGIKFCENGFHFHENIKDTNTYYDALNSILCEVTCKDVITGTDKSVCRSFKIRKILNQSEKLKLLNSGRHNSGIFNEGNHNSGNYNSGSCNSGYYNSGGYNSGNWNSCNRESGFFNTENHNEIRCFNKATDSYIWDQCRKPRFIYLELTTFVRTGDMTEEEKQRHPEFETAGGYLKTIGYKEAFIKSFNATTPEDVERLLKLPNFDYDIFEKISGISKEMIERKLKR